MSFDSLAPHYGWMERVLAGGKLQAMRIRWLDDFPTPRRALLAGEGNGRFLVELLRAVPSVEIVCVDASSAMHSATRRRMEQAVLIGTKVQFIHAQLPHSPLATGDFDLVATHFFLDCFPPDQLASVVENLAAAATGCAHWLLSDFCVPSFGLARVRARWILVLMYVLFRQMTLFWRKNSPHRTLF